MKNTHLTITLGDIRLSELGLRAQLVLTSVEATAPKNSTAAIEVNGKAGHLLKLLADRNASSRKEAYAVGKSMNADRRSIGQMLRYLDNLGAIKLSASGDNFTIS